jgi:nucleotide-binding universal stress UspA family protein
MKKILVAVDFSDGSARAVSVALDMAAKFNARVYVLHVLHDPSDAPGFYSAKKAGKKVFRNMEQSAQEMMEAFVKAHVKPRRKFDVAIVPGLPPDQILRIAKREKADLIVLGTRGRSGWERLMLGSVADHVVRGASCPVLTVPETPKERKEREKKEKRQEKKARKEEEKEETKASAESREEGEDEGADVDGTPETEAPKTAAGDEAPKKPKAT